MKVKVSEATTVQLDWLVAYASDLRIIQIKKGVVYTPCYPKIGGAPFRPTTDWAQGGPIIERMIEDGYIIQKGEFGTGVKVMRFRGGDIECQFGHTPLIAAMRCFCRSNLGDEVDVPEELL